MYKRVFLKVDEKNQTRITSGSQSNITSNCSAIVEDKIQ